MVSGELLRTSDQSQIAFHPPSNNPDFIIPTDLEPYTIFKAKIHHRPILTERGNPSAVIRGVMCTTDKGQWFLVPPDNKQRLSTQKDVPALNGATEAIAERQRNADIQPHVPHQANFLFSVANAGFLQRLMYRRDPALELPRTIPLFMEVDLNDLAIDTPVDGYEQSCGRADIVQIGHDGQIIVFEISSGGFDKKSAQVTRHALGLRTVIEQKNHGAVPPIATFVGRYKKDREGGTTMYIRQAAPNAAAQYAEATVRPANPRPPLIPVFDATIHDEGFTFPA